MYMFCIKNVEMFIEQFWKIIPQNRNKKYLFGLMVTSHFHDKVTLESLLNQFKSENSFLGHRTYPDK